jgi:hypothetical protein
MLMRLARLHRENPQVVAAEVQGVTVDVTNLDGIARSDAHDEAGHSRGVTTPVGDLHRETVETPVGREALREETLVVVREHLRVY